MTERKQTPNKKTPTTKFSKSLERDWKEYKAELKRSTYRSEMDILRQPS